MPQEEFQVVGPDRFVDKPRESRKCEEKEKDRNRSTLFVHIIIDKNSLWDESNAL
jgi:hypothetical protein